MDRGWCARFASYLQVNQSVMSIWNKILIGLNIVAAGAMLYLGARALRTHQYWQQVAVSLEEKIREQEKLQRQLMGELSGDELLQAQESGEPIVGIRQLEVELHKWLLRRGPAWYGCVPQQVDPRTGAVSVVTPFPDHRVQLQSVLYVFDQRDIRQGGAYLGQFTVTGIGGQENRVLQLVPTVKLSPKALQRLQRSAQTNGTAWALYRRMPPDGHNLFADFNEEQLKSILPAESVAEFLLDGKLTTVEDVKSQGLRGKVYAVDPQGNLLLENGQPMEVETGKGIFVRQLRDYETLFRIADVETVQMIDRLAVANRNKQYLKMVSDDVAREQQFRQQEVDHLKAEKAKLVAERDLVAAYRQALEKSLEQYRAAITQLVESNRKIAGQIAKIQLDAIRLMDQRTRQMAQAQVGQ